MSNEMSPWKMYWIQARMWVYLGGFGSVFLGSGLFLAKGFVSVPDGKVMVLIRKTGENLKSGQIIATKPNQKGIQLRLYPEGWHFLNPYTWDAKIVSKQEIPEGKLGVKIRLFGRSLRPGQVIAEDGQKGVVKGVLRPGRYNINPYAYMIELHDKVSVPPGYLGVVIRYSGKKPKDSNSFLTGHGERGVQKKALEVGDYYINPYIRRIVPVDVRAHKFEMIGSKGISFPSKDGFQITMDGTIEWYIDRTRVSEVFVKYVDTKRNVLSNIVDKIILPYARAFSRIEGSKHLARDFIGGQTRQQFQEAFLAGMKKSCGSQGIIIRSALVKNVVPPMGIITPIKKKEIAIRLREKFQQQMEREKQQKQLSIEETLQERAQRVKQAQADVSVDLTHAEREKEVAIINAQKKLQYARLRLEAAKNLARIVLARGEAKAKVIRLKNKANAEGLRYAVKAFGSGESYVRYLFYQKLAPTYRHILSNTKGPFLEVFRKLNERAKQQATKATSAPTPAVKKANNAQGEKR